MRRILVADDDPVTRIRLRATLERLGYEVVLARDGFEAHSILSKPDAPLLVILDWEMPGHAGVDLCRYIRQAREEPYTYVVILTGRSRIEDVIEAMDAGADSFLRKPVDMAELKARLRPGMRLLELQRQLIEAREEFRHQATHDPLTGLLNRRAILEILKGAVAAPPVTVAMVDIDHFKQINDRFGHDIGDRVLIEAAQLMRLSLRPEDAVGRIGGEEFLVVLPSCEEPHGQAIGERLRRRAEQAEISVNGQFVPLTFSVGIATDAREVGAVPYDALMKAADVALYRAKCGGRNQVVIGSPEPAPRSVAS